MGRTIVLSMIIQTSVFVSGFEKSAILIASSCETHFTMQITISVSMVISSDDREYLYTQNFFRQLLHAVKSSTGETGNCTGPLNQ